MYFQDFPVVPYPYYIGNNKSYAIARNIIRRVAFSDEINNSAAFLEYSIKDGERPEHIANRVYGDSNHHWIILLTNNIVDPYHGWCKSQTTMEQYIQKRYSGDMIYFSDAAKGFTYNFAYSDGCLLTQGTNSEPITSYRETFCELGVQTPKFSIGEASVTLPSGATTSIYIRKIVPAYLGVNHFSINRPTGTVDGSNGALEKPIVDPLALQSADYETTGVVLGTRIPASGLGGASPYSGTATLVDSRVWTVGSGAIGSTFALYNNTASENNRVLALDPWNKTTVVWQATSDGITSGATTTGMDGGWITPLIPIDRTKLYRFSVWVRRTVVGSGSGSFYQGIVGSPSNAFSFIAGNDTGSSNAYTNYLGVNSVLAKDVWYLVVGHVYPVGTAQPANPTLQSSRHPNSGIWSVQSGSTTKAGVDAGGGDWAWNIDNTNVRHRLFLYGVNSGGLGLADTTTLQFAYPRVEACDGTEPSIADLLRGDFSNTGATAEFWQTYIGKYMGVSGSEVTDYATSNYQYETNSNEAKRTIKILSPVFLNQALKELKSVLGV